MEHKWVTNVMKLFKFDSCIQENYSDKKKKIELQRQLDASLQKQSRVYNVCQTNCSPGLDNRRCLVMTTVID